MMQCGCFADVALFALIVKYGSVWWYAHTEAVQMFVRNYISILIKPQISTEHCSNCEAYVFSHFTV